MLVRQRCSAAKCGRLPSGSSVKGGIVMRPLTVTGQRAMKSPSSLGRDPALALLPGRVDLDEDPRVGRPVLAELGERRVRGHRVDQLHVREDDLDLAALELADEVPAEAPDGPRALASRSWARFSPTSSMPASASLPSSSSATYLTAARICTPSGSSSRTRATLSRTRAGVEPGDQLRHTTPAWRPVTPPVRRCEKNTSGWHIVHTPASCTRAPPSCARMTVGRSRLRSPRRAS